MDLQTKIKITIIVLIILYPVLRYIYYNYINQKNEYDVYVINMKNDKKRYKKITKELNNHDIEFRKIEGVNGNSLNIELLKRSKIIDKEIDKSFTLPQIGCSWSHKKTWIEAYKDKESYNDIIVIEDNTNLNSKFKKKLNKLSSELRGIQYDVCYLGRKPY